MNDKGKIPEKISAIVQGMPSALRELLIDELEKGNEIIEVGHSFPAPPVGAYFLLARPVTSRPHETRDGLDYYDRNTSNHSGEFTDEDRFFFVLEPPHQNVGEYPSMERHQDDAGDVRRPIEELSSRPSLLDRFEKSMEIDYAKWHDGEGYDLDAISEADDLERAAILLLLLNRPSSDWRDIEALAMIDSDTARRELVNALHDPSIRIRLAVLEYSPDLVSDQERTNVIIEALRHEDLFGGLTQALDMVEEYHPPKIVNELFKGVLDREGEVAVHFAAMLMYVHGRTKEPFDMSLRPFFLKFNTEDRKEREMAFHELCQMIGKARDRN